MAATQEMVKIAYEAKPDVVTLVPERREELTTEGGLDVIGQRDTIQKVVRTLRDGDIEVSLFIDPDLDQVKAAHKVGAGRIELHTGRYCDTRNPRERQRELSRIVDSAKTAAKLGIEVAAGHGLNYENVQPIASIGEIMELNIGHSIVARAVFVGMQAAVREMVELIQRAPPMR
ncbi:MAG: pyridoxine 5'-phosphate synthase, partial [Myxococcales bacterium]